MVGVGICMVLVGNYYFKVECSDVDIGVSDSVLIQIVNLGVPRVGILKTFAVEYVVIM